MADLLLKKVFWHKHRWEAVYLRNAMLRMTEMVWPAQQFPMSQRALTKHARCQLVFLWKWFRVGWWWCVFAPVVWLSMHYNDSSRLCMHSHRGFSLPCEILQPGSWIGGLSNITRLLVAMVPLLGYILIKMEECLTNWRPCPLSRSCVLPHLPLGCKH